jgi:NADH-quinone oxidoreductase chain I
MFVEPVVRVVKEMAKKPDTLKFPEQREQLADNYRGIQKLDMKTCMSCSACARICPNATITMVDAETEHGTKSMPEINLERCLFCGLCEEVCPTKCLVLVKNYELEKYDRRDFIKRPEELD